MKLHQREIKSYTTSPYLHTKLFFTLSTLLSLGLLSGCFYAKNDGNMASSKMIEPKDGELMMPTSYQNWPVFKANIDKEKIKQVRDIYINSRGTTITNGEKFPNGTVFVMPLYKARQTGGSVVKTTDGKLIKDTLDKVFIMQKGAGWGKNAPAGLRNGDWVYGAFNADGSKAKVDYNACRACHLPLDNKDYVFHYDQYFGH